MDHIWIIENKNGIFANKILYVHRSPKHIHRPLLFENCDWFIDLYTKHASIKAFFMLNPSCKCLSFWNGDG